MLRTKKPRTGAQVVSDFKENLVTKVTNMGKPSLPIRGICKFCIIIFSVSICVGFYGLKSRADDISKREQNIEKLSNELQNLEREIVQKLEYKEKLINDSLTIEGVARSYGMCKKGERAFYFQD